MEFRIENVVLVGDRGKISHKAIGALRQIEGLGWITALSSHGAHDKQAPRQGLPTAG